MRVLFDGHPDLEEFSFMLQVLIARLQESGVRRIGRCSLYFEPLDERGDRIALMPECEVAIANVTLPSKARITR